MWRAAVAALAASAALPGAAAEDLRFKYYYVRQPVTWPSGYYGDNTLTQLSEYRAYGEITSDYGVAWGAGDSDWQAVFCFDKPMRVEKFTLRYIVKTEWSKFAPKEIVVQASRDGAHFFGNTVLRVEHNGNEGRHTAEFTLPRPFECARYVKLLRVVPTRQLSVVGGVSIDGVPAGSCGEPTIAQRHARYLLPPPQALPPPPPKRFVAGIDFVLRGGH
ncbi:hypothetical protein DIPPA_08723 [Diplonema papillatum]|nr:hypothetical protein DIPPA_08723 [Diplonema papillatum]